MENKILRLSRIIALGILLLNIFHTADEFLKPDVSQTQCLDFLTEIKPRGGVQYVILLTNRSEVVINQSILPPAIGQNVTTYTTPWFGGLKAVTYDYTDKSGNVSEQWIGSPFAPRTRILWFSGILMVLCLGSLLIKRFEFAVGLLFFCIVLAGVRFWLLK